MTATQERRLPGWRTFSVRATLLSVLLFGVSAYPFYRWEAQKGLIVLGIGAGLGLILISISYALLEASTRRSLGIQFYAVLGGWVLRFGTTIAALIGLWYLTDLPRMAAVVSVVFFYLALLFYEAMACWPPRKRP